MSVPRGFVVVGSDTEVGKTAVACGLLRRLRSQGQRVGAYKPAASGLDGSPDDDLERLRLAVGGGWQVEELCPYRFAMPVAPLLAARTAGETIEWPVIAATLQRARSRCDWLVVETAGGLYSPLDDRRSNLDFAEFVGLPAVVVVPNRLGAINAAMLVCAGLLSRGLEVDRVIFNDLPHEVCEETVRRTNVELFSELHRVYLRCESELRSLRSTAGGIEAAVL